MPETNSNGTRAAYQAVPNPSVVVDIPISPSNVEDNEKAPLTPMSDSVVDVDLEAACADSARVARLSILRVVAVTFLLISLTVSFFSVTAIMHDLSVMKFHDGHSGGWLQWMGMKHGKGCRRHHGSNGVPPGMVSDSVDADVNNEMRLGHPATVAPHPKDETIEKATVNARILPPNAFNQDPTMVIDIDLDEQNPTPASRAAVGQFIRSAINKAKAIFGRFLQAYHRLTGPKPAHQPKAYGMTVNDKMLQDWEHKTEERARGMMNHMRDVMRNIAKQVEAGKGPIGHFVKGVMEHLKGKQDKLE